MSDYEPADSLERLLRIRELRGIRSRRANEHEWVTAYDVDGSYRECARCGAIASEPYEEEAADNEGCPS